MIMQPKVIGVKFRSCDLWVMGPSRFHCATPIRVLYLPKVSDLSCNTIKSVSASIGFARRLIAIYPRPPYRKAAA